MLHDVRTPHYRGVRAALIALVGLAFTFTTVGIARADAVRCKREIAKASARFADAKVKALQKCKDAVLSGKITGPCPDAKATTAMQKATDKLRAALDRKCGGVDRDCGSAPDNDALAAIGWGGGACPNFESGSCNNPITNCDGIGNCLLCVDGAAVDQGIALYYDALAATNDGSVKRCQRDIGKSAVKFLRLKSKILQKCKDKVIAGQTAGPCPDAKATAQIANAEAKRNSKICSSCGGSDRVCGGGDDLTPAMIGFSGSCPDVTIPGGAACGGAVGNLQQLVNCVGCVTNFKAECMDRIATPSVSPYPAECGGGPPPPTCGDNNTDPGEDCDGTSDAACPGQCAGNCTCPPPSCVLPNPLPAKVAFVGKPGSDLDTGWTGIGHDTQTVNEASLMSGVISNCDLDTGSPTCGECDLNGPIVFPGPAKNCVCFNVNTPDASSLTDCDPQAPAPCGGAETCQCLLGPPLPISAGAVPVCVVSRLVGTVTGTANISETGPHAGEGSVSLQLISAVHNGEAVEQPCPICVGDPTPRDGLMQGTCEDGVRDGMPCDVDGISEFFGPHSNDCMPASEKGIGNLSIRFNPATTGVTQLNTNRPCTDQTGNCFCSTCATLAAEPCNTNGDCPVGIICGGRRCMGGSNDGSTCTDASVCPGGVCDRPGTRTKRNACIDQICSPNPADGPHEGICEAGPIDRACSLEPFRGCSGNGDCNPPPSGTCPSCLPAQSCDSQLRQCFLDPIVREGDPDPETPIVAATFCIPPTTAESVNQVAGLPGPGALELPTRVFKIGANCGNGSVDGGEQCDGNAGACPGACQVDCQCPGCGNNTVDPGEACDGDDDANCPGQCLGNCACPATCGNNTQEFGEDCDGTDDDQCPGVCQPNCSCGAVCGDNVVEGTEECDGAGSTACPAEACQGDCTCGPFCGNNEIDPGEECDSGNGPCLGTCQADCQCAPFCGDDERQGSELCDGTDDSLCPGACSAGCTCPSSATITFSVAAGADLDTGWTGTAHDLEVQKGSNISGELSNCDSVSDFECDFFGNVGSSCAADPTQACLADSQCSAGGCTINTFGPPLPLSAGGVPACIINRFATDVTGSYNTDTGDAALLTTLNSLVHLGIAVSRPCPICDCGEADPHDCEIGDTGTCSDNAGGACRVQGTGPLGPTSNDCFPSTSSNVSGGGLIIPFQPVTTGTSSFASNQLCDGAGHTSENCWCDGQPQANKCANACDGGSNNNQACSSDAECPGAPAGACKPLCRQILSEAVGEGECVAGPPSQTCANAPEIGCQTSSNCPGATGPCVAKNQRCFLDPIVRIGTPDTVQNISVATFCIPATSASAINATAGLPGPGAISFPADISIKRCGDNDVNRFVEECDGTDDSNCPGACLANCTCDADCGNDIIEFGEQCDGTSDAACPGQCGAPASANPCICPVTCGDGFVGPGEECDPPADSGCPGECTSCQCPVPTATCLNNVLDPGEPCDVPGLGCGPTQACLLCQQCFPPYDAILPNADFICGNFNQEPTEVCELPAIGCGAGQLCLECDQCVDAIPFCGNVNIEPGEVCELPAAGCGPQQLCVLCNQCVDVPVPICGNLALEPGEVCELPQQGCGPLALCSLCQQCVPLF